MKKTIIPSNHHSAHYQNNKDRTFLKATGSVLLALIASSHHWLHTLLIALGLTTLGTGLLSMSPFIRMIFLLISLVFSIWFIIVAKRKWNNKKPAAWVYLISSIISIVLVATAIPQTISSLTEKNSGNINQPSQNQMLPTDHEKHHQ